MIVSASALRRDCGYPRALNRERKPTPEQQASLDRGTRFHGAIEQWAKTGEMPWIADDAEMQGWLDLLAVDWRPPVDGEYEVAWGLTPAGMAVPVDEPEPHVYVSRTGLQLLTAGRADAAWTDADCCLRVTDWKTGKWPVTAAEHNLQVNAAGIALALRRGMSSYTPGVYYARDGFWDWGPRVVFGSPSFKRIWDDIHAAALLDETPRPGPHCDGCWERKTKRCAHASGGNASAGQQFNPQLYPPG